MLKKAWCVAVRGVIPAHIRSNRIGLLRRLAGIQNMRWQIRCWKGLERDAREARKGLWTDPQRVAGRLLPTLPLPSPHLTPHYPIASGVMDTPPTLQ